MCFRWQLFKNSPPLGFIAVWGLSKGSIYPVLRKYPIFRRFFGADVTKNRSNTVQNPQKCKAKSSRINMESHFVFLSFQVIFNI
jgi:hypothetical protein